MGQLIIPNNIKFKGPWLLDDIQLGELSDTITVIEDKLDIAYNNAIKADALVLVSEREKSKRPLEMEEAIQLTKNEYPYNRTNKSATVSSTTGKKIKDQTLVALLKDPKIEDFTPNQLSINIVKGQFEFNFDVSSRWDGELEVRTKVDDEVILADINYEIQKWVNKHRPTPIIQIWSNWLTSFLVPAIIFVFVIILFVFPFKTEIYKEELKHQAAEILKDGVSQDETAKAIEIILQLDTEFVPTSFTKGTTNTKSLITILIIAVVIGIVLSIKPKTIIGLGRNRKRLIFYRRWTYFILFFVPISILLPIIINLLTQ